MYTIKQSTALTVPFFVHDTNGDAVTGLTDGSFTKRISKGSAAFGAMTVTITEMENGWYSIPLSATHSDTTGLLTITFTNAGAKQVNLQWRVEASLADDLATPTNITAGTIATVTNLTNLPSIPANWLTAAGINAAALNGKGDWNTVTPDAAGVAPTAAEVVDEWETQSQADPTGFHVNAMEINSNVGAAPNLALMYDGTGYTDDTAPASRAQLGALTVGSGGISTTANANTLVTTGTETLTFAATSQLDLSYHEVATAVSIEMYYEFDVTESGIPISVDWTGYVQSNGDNLEVYFRNWAGASWDQVGTISGANGTTPVTQSFIATTAHVGTGGDVGKVRFRMASSGGDVATNLATDRITCTYTQAVTGIANGSTVTLTAATANTNLVGNNWNLALGSQSITGSYVKGATVTGISSGSGITFEDCIFGAGTYPPGTYVRCGFGESDGLFTAASAGEYIFKDCFSVVAGSGSPDFTFAGLGGATGVNVRGWFGGSAWTLDTNCTLSLEVVGGGGTTITPADAAVEVRGRCRSLTLALADTDIGNIIQCIIDTGPIIVTSAGAADSAVITLHGHATSLADAGNGTMNNNLGGFVQTNAILTDTTEIGAAGVGLTEAGGDGDHLTAINLPNQTMDITGNLSGSVGSVAGNVDGSVGSNVELGPSEVNAEVLDVMNVDTFAEPGQGAPGDTISVIEKINYLYKAWRNRSKQDATTYMLYNSAETVVDQKATVSDDTTDAIKQVVGTGP